MTDETNQPLTRRRLLTISGTAAAAFGLAGCMGLGDGASEASETTTGDSPSSPATTTRDTATTQNGTQNTTENTTSGSQSVDVNGPRHGDDLPNDTTPNDGYPPEFQNAPQGMNPDPSQFETLQRSGFEVKLVPTDVAYYWWARGEARIADTRSRTEFDNSHIFGSVLSPAGDGRDMPNDPALQWPKGDRIITYCHCPHHLSSLRAASLMNRGYRKVYALDEGFGSWRSNNLPMAGSDVDRVPAVHTIQGSVPERHGGGTAWARHANSNQREATDIAADGSYELHLKFFDVNGQSRIRVETPAYSLTATLRELTNGSITKDGSVAVPVGGN